MKKKLFTLGILISTFVPAQQKEIPLNGEFGGTRCNNSIGLCSVVQNSESKNPQESKMVATKLSDTSFQLIIYLNRIEQKEESKIIGQNFSKLNQSEPPDFVMEEDFILDEETASAIGLKSGYIVIPAGKYPLQFDQQKVYITFTLKQP